MSGKLKKKPGPPPTPTVQARLSLYLERYWGVRTEFEEVAVKADELRKQVRHYEEDVLPELLMEMGVAKCTAEDGSQITVKDVLSAAVSTRNEKEATRILKRIGAGDVSQHAVNFMFTKAEKENLLKLLKWTKAEKVACESKTVINTATLKKVVAEALREGKLQPSDLDPLGVWLVHKAVVKAPKEII